MALPYTPNNFLLTFVYFDYSESHKLKWQSPLIFPWLILSKWPFSSEQNFFKSILRIKSANQCGDVMLDSHVRLPRDEKMKLSGTELDQHHVPISAASISEELWREAWRRRRMKNKIPSTMIPSSIEIIAKRRKPCLKWYTAVEGYSESSLIQSSHLPSQMVLLKSYLRLHTA